MVQRLYRTDGTTIVRFTQPKHIIVQVTRDGMRLLTTTEGDIPFLFFLNFPSTEQEVKQLMSTCSDLGLQIDFHV